MIKQMRGRAVVTYAEGPTTEVSVLVNADPATLWELVSDPSLPAEFSKELKEAGWDPDGPRPGIGARILGRTAIDGIGEWTSTSYVTAWEIERQFTWAVGNPDDPAALWSFLIGATQDGTSTLTQRVRIGPGRSNLIKMIEEQPENEADIIDFRLARFRENMENNLKAYKDLAEGNAQANDG